MLTKTGVKKNWLKIFVGKNGSLLADSVPIIIAI